MAFSKKSYAQDEIIIPCDLCGTSESASSYCEECLIHICDNCEQSHLRHTTVPVLEGLLEKIDSVYCSKHQERYTNYCETCRVNVCESCFSLDHRGHEYKNVAKHANKLRIDFSEKIESKKTLVTHIQQELIRIMKYEEEFENRTKKQIEKVWFDINERKKYLDDQGRKITSALELKEKEALQKLKNIREELLDLDIKLINLIRILENQMSNIPDEAVINFVNENETKLELTSIPSNLMLDLPSLSEFIQDLQSLGSLSSVSPELSDKKLDQQHRSLRQELKVVKKFSPTKGGLILSICATEDDMFWIGTEDRKLSLFNKEGEQELVVELPGKPCMTAVTGLNDVIVATGKHVIYKVTRQGQVSTFVDVSPGKVYDIATTQQGDVFACVKSGRMFKIKKFSSEGKFVLNLDSKMFTTGNYQGYVHAFRDDLVCIQDGQPDFDTESQLVFVKASGQAVSRVERTGHLLEFVKVILWDDQGNMLIGPVDGNYLVLFSGADTCSENYIYKVEGSSWINALCLGKNGVMWIGTRRGK